MATIQQLSAPYDPAIANASRIYGVPESLLRWQIFKESSFNPNATNGNAAGIAQFMPGTAAQYNVNVNDPVSSIDGAARYMRDLYARKGDWIEAARSYGTIGSPADEANARAVLQTGSDTSGQVFQNGAGGGTVQWFSAPSAVPGQRADVGVEVLPDGATTGTTGTTSSTGSAGSGVGVTQTPAEGGSYGMPGTETGTPSSASNGGNAATTAPTSGFSIGSFISEYAARLAALLLGLMLVLGALIILSQERKAK